MAIKSWNYHGTIEYVLDAEADLASIPNPKLAEVALALAEGSLWFHTGTVWQEIGGGGPGGGAPTTVDYLVGTADATLSNEIVVGPTPGGELGGTWASPTVDATHSGSAHVTDHGALTGLTDNDHTQYILHSIADAVGDLLVASGADAFARLALGGDGTVLTVSGGTASWQAPGAGSHPDFASHTKFGVD